jgi:hypothetical protein
MSIVSDIYMGWGPWLVGEKHSIWVPSDLSDISGKVITGTAEVTDGRTASAKVTSSNDTQFYFPVLLLYGLFSRRPRVE